MNTFKRKMAKEIICPTTAADLAEVVDKEFEYQNHKLCNLLRKAMKQWAGDANLEEAGPKQFGAENFKNIYYENKLPCLKNLIKLVDKLNLTLTWKNYPFAYARAVPRRDITFGAKFDHGEFIAFLNMLGTMRGFRGDSREMQKERLVILKKLSNPAFPLHWTTLIRYVGACGYQPNFYLNSNPKADGCLTPSRKKDQPKPASTEVRSPVAAEEQGEWYLDASGREDYEALIRRLNYPA